MKQLARKTRLLSLVSPAAGRSVPSQETSSSSFRGHLDGWLNSAVPADVPTGRLHENPALERSLGWRALSYTDITRVNRATVRESMEHRHWPLDVVEKFLLADVIKPTFK